MAAELMQRWTQAMRDRRFDVAWNLSADALALRDPASRDDPSLPYHQRWVWDGRPVDGRDVLVRCYHGLGDTIQFARFLPLLASRARNVTVEMQPDLLPLFSHWMDRIGFHPFDLAHPLPPAECNLEIMDLAFALRAAPDVHAAPYLPQRWQGSGTGTIGLCHAAGGWDADRNLPAMLLQPLCERHDCTLLMPQPTGPTAALPVRNPAGCPGAIADTAALIATMDLVVTVDTMIAHLAGAMGVPVWVMLKHEPDWRWNPAQSVSCWYPGTRQFVQTEVGDWAGVVRRIEGALADRPHHAPPSVALAGT
ncbi:glycosyltransferase family 9 protein [Croceibacterium mercuriale]|uniref:glycosyltransferase family 9 protein n=1 Tax=Croceibacterium mercuriale TaxID=1572751 RepID=UPI001F337C8F|nr:glycosyltransferase family 9 protein [Croceibacterium mercuriale]